ncbi:MAG: TonB-dependent receptor [Phycisphaerales bacterium]|nr:TonB-dependent receptor [Phycisphaerales bacterium]
MCKIQTFLLFILILFNCYPLWSQQKQHVHLSGTLKDEQGNALPNASLYIIPSSNGLGVNTDNNGRFRLPYNHLPVRIVVEYVGYNLDTFTITNDSMHVLVMKNRKLHQLQDIVVQTGSASPTTIRTNPMTIVKVSQKMIQMTTESNIIDVLVQNVAGLNAVKTGPNISKPYIRGLGYNRVLTLFDGMRQEGQQWGDEHGLELDDYLIGDAEVLEGPASIIYGSDAIAGVISLSPVRPTKKDGILHGATYSEYQSNNGMIGNSVQLNYGKKHFSFLVDGSYRIAKNYVSPVDGSVVTITPGDTSVVATNGRVYNSGFREANGSAFFYYTDARWKSELGVTVYDNRQGIPDGTRDSLTRQFTYQIYESQQDNPKDRPIVSQSVLNSYNLSPLHQRIQHYRIYNNSSFVLPFGDLSTLIGFQQNIRREYNHPTDVAQAGLYVRLNTVNYNLKYNLTTRYNTLHISTGVNGMYQNNKNLNATEFPIPNYQLFDMGAFVYARWELKKWVLSAGLRYDLRWMQGDNFYTATNPVNGFTQQWLGDTTGRNVTLAFPSFTKFYNNVSASIGATYALNNHISFKVNVGKGYRAPNITEFASNGLDPGARIYYIGDRNLVPEYNVQEDIGVLFNYDVISASVSVFNNNIQNFIYLTKEVDANGIPVEIVPGNFTYAYRQNNAQIYGVEATATVHPSRWKGFMWSNNFAMTYGFNRNPMYKDQGVMGEYLPLIPPIRLISNIQQTLNFHNLYIPSCFVNVGLEFSNKQNRYLALDQTETATPAYTLFNVSLGMSVRYVKQHIMEIQFQTNNIFNVAYQSNLSRLKYFEYYTQSPTGRLGIYNMGRNICGKVIFNF